MKRDILVLTEPWAGEVDTITYQMLSKGRQLADALGVNLKALVIGHRLDAPISQGGDPRHGLHDRAAHVRIATVGEIQLQPRAFRDARSSATYR